MNSPTATVVRDGREQVIDPAALVKGDIVHVGAGDQIVVDGTMIGAGVRASTMTRSAQHR